ncbi:MAG: NAD+ synthase [Ilumatobacteraceae bacterium]|nr:NAD+ synthase [Ilumatobacteraceae bacterium]
MTSAGSFATPKGLTVGLSQLNPLVGDLLGNEAKILADYATAEAAGCQVVVYPELTITGYPPEDLLLKKAFVRDNESAVERIAARTKECAALIGFVKAEGDHHFNAVALCRNGKVQGVYLKQLLPNYAVFDEDRYFTPGPALNDGVASGLFTLDGVMVGVTICEDIWYADGPVAAQAAAGARIMLNLNASPFHEGKNVQREQMLSTRAKETNSAIVYVNQVGAQDELVFDGSSVVVDCNGVIACRMKSFESDFAVVTIAGDGTATPTHIEPFASDLDRVYDALVVGTRDYVHKNGFTDVVIGLSGGIDSSIVAAIAVDALGADHVHGVAMPSRYSSQGSLDDADKLASALGIDHRVVSIEPAFGAYLDMLQPSFTGRDPDLTEENLQSRVRGMTLMALSNKFGWMVLTTGNKSEMAVGYFTIYGDSAGGYAAIKDVFKTQVFALCRRINERAGREIIPETVITKPPSAELRPDQRDDQSLPAYEDLDPILRHYIDNDLTVPEIQKLGFDAAVVARIARLVDINEYKRRQCAPGVRISEKAFGKDRRMPITNGYRTDRA